MVTLYETSMYAQDIYSTACLCCKINLIVPFHDLDNMMLSLHNSISSYATQI